MVSDLRRKDELLHEVLQDLHPLTTTAEFDLEDFLWSGSGEKEKEKMVDGIIFSSGDDGFEDYDIPESDRTATPPIIVPTPVVVSTVFTTVYRPGEDGPDRGNSLDELNPTPVLITPSAHVSPPPIFQSNSEKLPAEKFLVRTVVLSNMTVIHAGIEAFKADMENKLTRAYRRAYGRDEDVAKRRKRDSSEEEEESTQTKTTSKPIVKIHNIRSSLPEPEIEMIYTVSDGERATTRRQMIESGAR